MSGLLDYALAAHEAGLCVVPPRQDGSKRPLGGWERWQSERPSPNVLRQWYSGGRTGVGFVCGQVSGNREMFEFEDGDTHEQFRALAAAEGKGELVERVEDGYLERTPGGGVHLLYRCDEIGPNTRLACRPKRPEEMRNPHDKIKVLIETRGEGGYMVAAPSSGTVHPSGRPYVLVRGGVATIPTISPSDRQELWNLARTFDEMPFKRAHGPLASEQDCEKGAGREKSPVAATGGVGNRPGDDFNARATWEEILEPHGWTLAYQRGGTAYWKRPGTDNPHSASTDHDGSNLFYCWSTSTEFESERGYNKFSAYTVLNHGGDFHAAAAELGARGYGDQASIGRISMHRAADQPDGPVHAFPLETLPPVFRTFVQEGAASLVAPPDFLAVPLLVLAGAVIGNAAELELKPGWREGPNLYAAIVGDPGSKKSPALALAARPVHHIQRRLAHQHEQAMTAYERELARWDAQKKGERAGEPKPVLPPPFPHLYTTDATTEALAPMLRTAKAVALYREELAGWVRSMDQYRGGKGADRQHFLSMWSRQPIKVDRKGAPPILVARPHLSVIGGIQPDLLPDLADATQREDGFIDRLLWGYPDPVPDHWTLTAGSVPADPVLDRAIGHPH